MPSFSDTTALRALRSDIVGSSRARAGYHEGDTTCPLDGSDAVARPESRRPQRQPLTSPTNPNSQ
jgi:hypothetical protein